MEVYRVVSELGLTLIPILAPTVGAEIGRHNATGVPHCHLWPLLDGAIANMKLGGLCLTGSKALRITGCGAIMHPGRMGHSMHGESLSRFHSGETESLTEFLSGR